MALISRSKIWVPGDILTSGDLNGELNIAFNLLNGGIDSANIGTLQTLGFVNATTTSTITFNNGGANTAWKVVT